MDSLNLDIDSYTPFDLQNLFSLSSGYSQSDVSKGKAKLMTQLDKTKSLGPESKRQIAFFIDTAVERLSAAAGKKDPSAGTWGMKENPMDTGSSHFVISNPNTLAGKNAVIADGRQAGTDDVPSGWLNPINVRTVMHGLNLDSRFRDNYYQTNSSDFTFHLPNPQKKVTNMRIATLDIPMTYHCINRSNGSSTMLVLPAPITYNQAYELQDKDVKIGGTPLPNLQNVWTSASDVQLGPGESNSVSATNGAIDYFFHNSSTLKGTHVYYGTWQGEGKYSVFDLPEPTGEPSGPRGLATYRAGWLVVVPDGNYENTFASENEGMDITRAMNSAITRAQPCLVDRGSGTTYILLSKDPRTNVNPVTGFARNAQGNPVGYVPFINAGLGGKLVFSVDRASGRASFALPDTQSTSAVINEGSGGTSNFSDVPETPNRESTTVGGNAMIGPPIDDGFELVFAVDSGGNFNPATNIQLRLGWQLGYRIGQYNCQGYYYDPTTTDKHVYNATSVISEGICMITGPRYMYISIDDGNHNVGSNFTAIFSESTLGEHIMTRINLSSTMDSTGVFKCASDAGLSNQLNRTREYFGPVDISRLKIKLMDEYGRIINFNNMDWSMSMVFEKLYD